MPIFLNLNAHSKSAAHTYPNYRDPIQNIRLHVHFTYSEQNFCATAECLSSRSASLRTVFFNPKGIFQSDPIQEKSQIQVLTWLMFFPISRIISDLHYHFHSDRAQSYRLRVFTWFQSDCAIGLITNRLFGRM